MKKSELRNIIREEIKKMNESKPNTSAKKLLKGLDKIKVNGLGGYMPGVDYVYRDKSNGKVWFVDTSGDAMELKNKSTLQQLDKFIK